MSLPVPRDAVFSRHTYDYGWLNCMTLQWHGYRHGVALKGTYKFKPWIMQETLLKHFWRYLGAL